MRRKQNNIQALNRAAAAVWMRVESEEPEQSVCSVFESYRVSFSACQKHPGSEAMTDDIRYVSPITRPFVKSTVRAAKTNSSL